MFVDTARKSSATIGTIGITGDFTIVSNTCPFGGLPGGARCVVTIAFKPTVEGARTGVLSVFSVPDSITLTTTLSGTGTIASVTPRALTFSPLAVGSTSAQGVQVVNILPNLPFPGNPQLEISEIAITGKDSAQF